MVAAPPTGPTRVFVRNEKGQVFGPLELSTVSLLVDSGHLAGKLEVSVDGVRYGAPGQFPALRDAFPQELWGPGPHPAGTGPAAPARPAIVLGGEPSRPSGTAAAIVPPPPAGAPVGFTAGPGTRTSNAGAAAPRRPPPPVITPSKSEPAGKPTAAAPAPAQPGPVPAPAGPRSATPPAPAAPASPAPTAAAPPASAPPSSAPAAATPARPAAAPAAAVESLPGPPATGDLARSSAVHLYYLAASANETGLLTLRLADRTLEIHFKKGAPEFVGSSHPEDSERAFLIKQGLVRPEQLTQAEASLASFGGELLSALFGMGILNPATAFSQLGQRATGLLLRGLIAEDGAFTFERKELPAHKAMPLGNKWAVLSDLVRRIPGAELRKRLASAWELPVMKSGGRVATSELRLTPQETRALGYLDGVRSLAQLTTDLPQEAEGLVRVVFLLKELENVGFAAMPKRAQSTSASAAPPGSASAPAAATAPGAAPARPAAAAPPASARPAAAPAPATPAAKPAPSAPAAAPGPAPATAPTARPPVAARMTPAPPAQPATPAPAATPENDVVELRKIALKIKEQTKFEVLGLTEKSDPAAIKAAYFHFAKTFHPDTVTADSSEEVARLKGEIFSVVSAAYKTLSDEKARAAYLDELKHGAQQVDVHAILQAEDMFQRGTIMVKARKFADAVKMLDDAIAANPDEGEFYAWRGFAKFFTFTDKKQGTAEAMKDLQACLKKNERCAPAHYFLGQIAKLTGDVPGSAKHFKRTVEIQPDHVDALRELRILGVRK